MKAPKCPDCKRYHYGTICEPNLATVVKAQEVASTILLEVAERTGRLGLSVTKMGRGRPKRYENAAAKQKAYRARKK